MGCECECFKFEESTKEIKTYNIEEKENYILLKNDKIKEIDTYINSIKTSDKNTFNGSKNNEISQQNKKDNNKISFSLEKANEKIKPSKNNSNEDITKKALDNQYKKINSSNNNILIKNLNSSNKNSKNYSKISENKTKPKTKKENKLKKDELPKDEFSKYIFEQINKIRVYPQSFIQNIEQAKSFISVNKNNKLIYKKNVKVALSQGILAFEEAISILKICTPMNKLIFDPGLVVKLPQNEEEITDKSYFKNEIKKMKKNGIPIKSYWRDIIKEPETSFLMMIVDDTGLKAGLKRKDILDPNLKYIGICSTLIGKHFVCFMTFSNSKH